MAAVRLWRSREEEKRVWNMFFFHCHLFLETLLLGNNVGAGGFTVMFDSALRCCSRRWLSSRRPGPRKTSSSILAA